MGDELSLPGRMAVRTPMQWSAGRNGGFSDADPERLVLPLVQDERFGPRAVNVESQLRDPGSLLDFFRRLIRTRHNCPEIGCGEFQIIESGDPHVFAHRFTSDCSGVVAFHNLSGTSVEAAFSAEGVGGEWGLTDLLGDREYDPIGSEGGRFRMEGYGFRWMRMLRDV